MHLLKHTGVFLSLQRTLHQRTYTHFLLSVNQALGNQTWHKPYLTLTLPWKFHSMSPHNMSNMSANTHMLLHLLTSFTAGLGVQLFVWVHLSKGHMEESVKQKTFAHRLSLMSTLLLAHTKTKRGRCVFEVQSRQIYCSTLTGDGI